MRIRILETNIRVNDKIKRNTRETLANVAKYYDVDKKSCTNTLLALTGIKIRDEQTKKRKCEIPENLLHYFKVKT